MSQTLSVATNLFQDGDYLQLINSIGRSRLERNRLEPSLRVILANALALTGDLEEAQRLAEIDRHPPSSTNIRAQAESTLAVVSRRLGDQESAVQHAQKAVYLAQETNDSHLLAWTHLHLFRLLVDGGSAVDTLTRLPDVRRVVERAGLSQATACLHNSVSVLEGQTGRLDESRRHCDIAEGLLKIAPNNWLAGAIFLNRGVIALLDCEFDTARHFIRRANEAATRSGHSQTATAIQSNLGHLHLLVGDFEKAKHTFELLLKHPQSGHFTKLAAADGLARVHLALGELTSCGNALDLIDKNTEKSAGPTSIYQTRWAAITRARLLIRLEQPLEAIASLQLAESCAETQDLPLVAAIQLTQAQALAAAGLSEGVGARLVRSSEMGITAIRDLQAQYYCGSGQIIRDAHSLFAEHLIKRADRVWKAQGIVSVKLEMRDSRSDTSWRGPTGVGDLTPNALECVVDSLAALSDLAHRPRLLAEEIVSVLNETGCSTRVKILDEASSRSATSDDIAVLSLGKDNGKYLSLVCEVPSDPVKAILLADVLRMGRAALELERARQEDRNRAAIWPALPIEEQAGALFLAEEMQQLLATVRRIASSTVPVLITGETGTGKEVLARTLHLYSTRASSTFLPFNCSSVPKDMLDSQLFGHRKGSFTGAIDNFPGVIRAASGGTLFLDEIGEISLDVQPKLLRFLESNEVHPIGETQPVRADVRIVAATNAHLDTLVAQGRFREDLFYRLNIVQLPIPPLRERRIEIPALANHYLHKYAMESHRGNLRLAEETMDYLLLYRWPGNVRQLANEMRRMAALAEPGAVLMPEHLSPAIAASRRTIPASERTLDPTEIVVRIDQPMSGAVTHVERTMIQNAMRLSQGRVEDAARMLGVSRKGLYLKRVRYGLEPPRMDENLEPEPEPEE